MEVEKTSALDNSIELIKQVDIYKYDPWDLPSIPKEEHIRIVGFHPTEEELVGFYLRLKAEKKPISIELIKQVDICKYDPWDLPSIPKEEHIRIVGFHPTEEELVGFYLRLKAEKKPISIELIKQVDIYKYDPWDLPSILTEEHIRIVGFHPTEEELVGFYLRLKAEKKPISIELIKQVDIYKYDPWDLPSIPKEEHIRIVGFHPTEEELVGFYLRLKAEKKPISIELIKQVDIYKYDPWDLPSILTEEHIRIVGFHPTEEELVGFYLRLKAEKKPISIELIKQVDIYKYDPWDLPRVSTNMGDREWYFFCIRGRTYRNSIRSNRVTGSGFWKATGIDKPIYSVEATNEFIGLKKSLVYYRGSTGKGTKTDWMMHEFRLPPDGKGTYFPNAKNATQAAVRFF